MPGIALRVATFNIHGGKPVVGPGDLNATAAAIRALDADFVGLQEVYRLTPYPSYWDDQPGRLRLGLGMHVSFLPSLGLGRFGYGNAIVSRARPDRVTRLRLPGGREPRALLHARFALEGRPFHFLCTHLSLRAEERAREVTALTHYLAAIREPYVLAGDLNTAPGGPDLVALNALGLSDCTTSGLLTFPSSQPTLKLDYLLASAHFAVGECRAIETPASDHLPLVADLVLRTA